jgi:hypothetical protein
MAIAIVYAVKGGYQKCFIAIKFYGTSFNRTVSLG